MGRTFTNDFSWSKSRHEKFSECLRAYYLHYYFSWGGWESGAHPDAKEAWLLKKLTNRFAWVGTVVHDHIRDALLAIQAGRQPTLANTLDHARSVMRGDYRHSRAQGYRRTKWRKEFTGFLEHEYREDVDDAAWKRAWANAEEALTWFFAQSRWPELARGLRPEQWIEVDAGFESGTFTLDGVKVFAVPDFVYRADDGHLVVVDWKTGSGRDGYDAQVLGYALYLADKYRVDPTSVEAQLVYLNGGTEAEVHVDQASIATFRTHFANSVGTMRGLLEDPVRNLAKPMEAFAQTSDPVACGRCNFRRLCGREAMVAGDRPRSSEA